MAVNDRFNGVLASKAIKVPCVVATSANITLSGNQTIDGVAVVTDDRVLVRAQTNAVENGIYIAKDAAWERAADWDGNRDITRGTQILAYDSANNASIYVVETDDPIYINTTAVTISLYSQGASVAVEGGTTQHAVLRWDGVDTYREAERIQVTQQGAEFRIYASNLTDYGEFTYSGSVLALSLNDPAHQIFVSNDLVVTGADLYVAGDGLVYLGEQVGPGAGVGGQGIWWTGVGTPGVPYFMGDGSTKYKLSSEQEVHYGFDTDTTATDPGTGDVKFDNASLAAVTAMYISDTPDSGQDISWILGNLQTGDVIKIVSASSSAQYLIAKVSGAPTDNTGWWTVPLEVIHSGTLFDLFQVLSFEVEWLSQVSATGGLMVKTWTYDDTITSGDPGPGTFRFNAGAPGSASQFWIDDLDVDGNDIGAYVQPYLEVGMIFRLQSTADPADYYEFAFENTGTDITGWWSFLVNQVAGGTTFPADGTEFTLEWSLRPRTDVGTINGNHRSMLSWNGGTDEWEATTPTVFGINPANPPVGGRIYSVGSATAGSDRPQWRHVVGNSQSTMHNHDVGPSTDYFYDRLDGNTSPDPERWYFGAYDGVASHDIASFTLDDEFRIENDGTLLLADRAAARTSVTGYGELWVNSATDDLTYTDETGTGYILNGPGGVLPLGTTTGELLRWNGSAWVSTGDDLTFTPGATAILEIRDNPVQAVGRISIVGDVLELGHATSGDVKIDEDVFIVGVSATSNSGIRQYNTVSTGTHTGAATDDLGIWHVDGYTSTLNQTIPAFADEEGRIYPLTNLNTHLFSFNNLTTNSDPGSGSFKMDNATIGSVTNLYVDDLDGTGELIDAKLWGSLNSGDLLVIYNSTVADRYSMFTVNGTPTDNTGWWTIPVTYLAGSSIPASNDACFIDIQYHSRVAGVVADGTQTDAMLRWSGSAWVENTTARLESGNAEMWLNNVADIITGFNDTSVPFAIGNKTSGGTFFSFDAYGSIQAQAASAAASISINSFGGSVSIGDSSSPAAAHIVNLNNYLVRVTNGTMEIASAADDKNVTTGYGQLWVKNDTPERMFYSDGNDTKWPLQSVHEAEYAYSSTVTAADPGTATLRFDSVTIGLIANLYIDDLALSEDWGWILSNLADGDILVIKSAVDPADYIVASVNGAPTDNTGWWTVPLTLIHTGTIFTDGDPLRIEVQWFSQAGGSLPSGTTTDAVLKWGGAAWVEETGVRIDDGTQQLRVYDNTGETDYIGLRHNDIDAFIECTNTTNLDFDGFSVARFRGASSLQVYDGDNSAYVDIQASDSVAVISTGIAGDLELNAVGGDVRIALGDNLLVRGGSLVVYDSAALDTFTVDVGATDVDFIMGGSVAPIRYKFQDAPIFMEERAAAEVDVVGYGQIWVSSVDSHLYFTDDGGTDYQISGTGGGNVSNTGTPLDNQIAVWTNATTIEGSASLTWDATTLLVTGTIAANNADGPSLVNETPSSVNPTLLPRRSDDNTGIGSAVADTVSIIAGGIEFVRFNESTNNTCDFYVPIYLEEQALANPDVAGWGQIWVESTTTPANRMGFTDDTGEDSYYGAFGIEFNENATRPYGAPGAGKGMLWIVNTNPCELLYQSDIDQTFALINVTNDFLYQFSTTTTAADPGQGFIRWNNATPASVTAIYVDNLDVGGSRNVDNDVGSLRRGDVVHIQAQQNNTRYGFFSVESVTDNTGWWTINVTPIDTGTLPTNNEPIHLEFHRCGYQTLQDYAIEDPGEYTPTGTTQTLTYSDGPAFQVDLESVTGNITITLSGGPPTGTYGQIVVKVTQDSATARTITWAGGTFNWAGGTAHPMNSTLNGFSIYTFETWDAGTTWWGAGADYS